MVTLTCMKCGHTTDCYTDQEVRDTQKWYTNEHPKECDGIEMILPNGQKVGISKKALRELAVKELKEK